MKITKIEVKNFRLLNDFSLDVEDTLSLVIGKNNCGKTSLLVVLDKFINSGDKHRISYNDFSISLRKELVKAVNNNESIDDDLKISLKLFIKYDERDDLSNISNLMMNLDPKDNNIVLLYEYFLSKSNFNILKEDYMNIKRNSSGSTKDELSFFLKNNCSSYFNYSRKSVSSVNSKDFIDLDKENISLKDVISYKFISANRDVSNKESDKSLSSQSYKIYDQMTMAEDHKDNISKFKNSLYKTDNELSKFYQDLFSETIEQVNKFGGLKPGGSKIMISSTLQHKNLLKGNTTVSYLHGNEELPENYNGLGYMNLISMIFEIGIKVNEFKRGEKKRPADINLLFIEEPEAHTHPQMQYVFIKNIKNMLNDCWILKRELQYIITSHSSHIVAESDFNDIKYFKRNQNNIIAKNLKELEEEYNKAEKKNEYNFLKKYLTLQRTELFFADKVIFIEGPTERILLPAMMKKIDDKKDNDNTDKEIPLLSQNISVIEVGNYSHIFEKFISFIGIRTLIITDIDSAMTKEKLKELKRKESDKMKQKIPVGDKNATITTNASLVHFYGTDKLSFYKNKSIDGLVLSKGTEWTADEEGGLLCVYQFEQKVSENNVYHASSFEDSFIHLNRSFIIENKKVFQSLKNRELLTKKRNDPYFLAENCIDKKPSFAIDILLNSNSEFSNWKTPSYIEEGLLWLKKNN